MSSCGSSRLLLFGLRRGLRRGPRRRAVCYLGEGTVTSRAAAVPLTRCPPGPGPPARRAGDPPTTLALRGAVWTGKTAHSCALPAAGLEWIQGASPDDASPTLGIPSEYLAGALSPTPAAGAAAGSVRYSSTAPLRPVICGYIGIILGYNILLARLIPVPVPVSGQAVLFVYFIIMMSRII